MFGKHKVKQRLKDNHPFLIMLIGITIISLTLGPYRNGDTRLEYAAATGVLNWGMPYAYSIPNIIDEPPLGYYTEAAFFKIFGLSVENGVFLITLLGLGCTTLIYKIGKDYYGKSSGLLAAALFALSPWHLVLTRSFLIDTQCLFLSLCCLYVGILAIRRDSVKLTAVSGILFALALLTKLYAAFVLLPLLLFYIYRLPKRPKQILTQLVVFALPALYSSFFWYQLVLGKGLLYMVQHSDFNRLNGPDVVPTYSFLSTFLVNYGLGVFFVAATVFSLVLSLAYRKKLSKFLLFDVVCLLTVVVILVVDAYLAVNLNLKVPYTSAVKYDYQTLPFFSLLAGSLAAKCVALLSEAKAVGKLKKAILVATAMAIVSLLSLAILTSINYIHQFSTQSYMVFEVELGTNHGYSLFNRFPIASDSAAMTLQYVGFALVLFALAWESRAFIKYSFKPMQRWIKEKTLANPAR